MARRKNKLSFEDRAARHIKVMRHPAIATVTGWTCLQTGCDAAGGDCWTPPADDGGDNYFDNHVDGRGF